MSNSERLAALDDFLAYAGVTEGYPFSRLVQLIREERTKCRNQDNRDYWRYVEEKLMALASRQPKAT